MVLGSTVDGRRRLFYKCASPRAMDGREATMMGGGIIWWIVVGLIAGWLAGKVMRGGGYGVLLDILLGIVGAVLGGWLFGELGVNPGFGMIGSILIAFIGACILLGIVRLIKRA